MSSYDILQNNFPSGELSPLWRGRSNTQFYQTGLALCRNFMPMSPSGLRRRPGTRYLKTTHDGDEAVLVPVNDGETNLVYELTYGHVRVWNTSTPSLVTASADSTYLNYAFIDGLQIAVNKGVIWIATREAPVTRITLSGSTLTVDRPTFSGDVTFSTSGMYPKAIGFTGGRLVLGFPSDKPNSIFMSRTPDYSSLTPDRYTDFTFGTTADYAIELEDAELIGGRWFLNQIRFLVGSSKAIFMDGGQMITPETFDISPALHEGSADIPAKGMRNYIVYAGVSGKTLSMMVYNRDSEGYQTRDLTTDSAHLFSPGIKDFAITFMPELVIWVLLKSGDVLSCTVDSSTGTIFTGWALHEFGFGGVQSICAGRLNDGRDILYMTVRTSEGYHIETLEMQDLFSEYSYSISDSSFLYLDSALSYTGASSDNILYFKDYAGKEVSIYSRGCVLPNAVVDDDGYVQLDREVTNCVIGLPFRSVAGFLSQEQPANGQSSFGNVRRLKKVTLRLYKSMGGYIGLQYEDVSLMNKLLSARYGYHEYGDPIALESDDIVIDMQSQNITDATLYVLTDFPTPLNVLAVKEKIELLEV